MCVCACVCVCSILASVRHAASSPPADSAEAGSGAAEGALPLPQHQTRRWTGLCVPAAGPRLQPVKTHEHALLSAVCPLTATAHHRVTAMTFKTLEKPM